MKKYTVTQVLTLAAGTILGLTAGQAARRAHALKPAATPVKLPREIEVYETTAPVQFKVGEVIHTAAEINKGQAASLEGEGKQPPKVVKADQAQAARIADLERQLNEARHIAEDVRDKAAAWDEAKTKWDAFEAEAATLREKAAAYDALQAKTEPPAPKPETPDAKADTKASKTEAPAAKA